jgi:hypothetical protein
MDYERRITELSETYTSLLCSSVIEQEVRAKFLEFQEDLRRGVKPEELVVKHYSIQRYLRQKLAS